MKLILKQCYSNLEYDFDGNTKKQLQEKITNICKDIYDDDVKYLMFFGVDLDNKIQIVTNTKRNFQIKIDNNDVVNLVNDLEKWYSNIYTDKVQINIFKNMFQNVKNVHKMNISSIYCDINHHDKIVHFLINFKQMDFVITYNEWKNFHNAIQNLYLADLEDNNNV